MRTKTKRVEKLKNIMIVVLTISAILLLYFLWKNVATGGFSTPIDLLHNDSKIEQTEPSKLVVPERIVINQGTEVYKCADENIEIYWGQFVDKFREFALSENIFAEEITKQQWDQATAYVSIMVEFNYDLNFSSFCSLFSINRPATAFDQIDSIYTLAYSEASRESVIIFNRKNNKYFRIAASKNPGLFGEIITDIDNSSENLYRPMYNIIQTNNSELVSLDTSVSVSDIYYSSEIEKDSDDITNSIAQHFFGENFDFIRTIKETNNTMVYMYGYGERLLTVSADGLFEYKEDLNNSGVQESFYSAFCQAVDYIDNHGGFIYSDPNKETSYLKNVEIIDENKKRGYRMTFGLKVEGIPVYYKNNEYMVIDIIGNQITYYKRFVILPQFAGNEGISNKSVMQAPEVITMSYNNNSMRNIFTQNGVDIPNKPEDNKDYNLYLRDFEDIVDRIESIRIGYLKQEGEESGMLRPVWVIQAESIEMYYDIQTGESLGFTAYTEESKS